MTAPADDPPQAGVRIPPALAAALAAARRVVALTGAGVSAESGVPTFRDALKELTDAVEAEIGALVKKAVS